MSLASLPQVNGSGKGVNVAALRDALSKALSGEARFERLDRALYSTDASVYQIVPLGVVIPRSASDVQSTLEICSDFGVPITARGGGTSQAGQSIGAGVVIDCSKYFNRILEVNAAERWVRVESGCVLDELNQHVKPLGLQFAPDISTANRATIGGMVANNSSGTHSLIHGKTIDHVLELRVLLADGSVIETRELTEAELELKCQLRTREGEGYRALRRLASEQAREIDARFPKILRRVGGYNLENFVPTSPTRFNLSHLFAGSEGTLGILLECKLRLIELPRAKALLVVQFANLLDALAAVPAILVHRPAAVEVMDRFILDCTKLNAEASRLRDFLEGEPGAILIVEFYAEQASELLPRLEALEAELGTAGLARTYHRATDAIAQARVWKLRTLALGLSMAEKGDSKAISFVEDTAVAPERLRDYIADFLAVIARHGTSAGVYAHASVGCLHVRPIVNLKTEGGVRQFQSIAEEVANLVLKYGGALSGEHGDGLVRSPFQEKMFGPILYETFREIKRTFDPMHLLNPGKIVDARPMIENLRYGPAYRTLDVPTAFDFSVDGGIVRAAELCAGVGECRKVRGGTMCPSFQATRDEQHSTRGRANTLRLALTGQIDLAGLTDPSVMEALDLCLECKACKTECPTNVDMARLKAEVLHQHHQKQGLPWRNWMFGNVAWLSKWGSRATPVSNWLTRSSPGRWLNEKLLGVDRRRLPPAFASKPLTHLLHAKGGGPNPVECEPDVLVFTDTFANYYEPENGLAMLDLLQALGCHAVVGIPEASLACCGRPLISNGMLTEATRLAAKNVAILHDWVVTRDKPIIAYEPSCILTIKDDYPALLRGEIRDQARAVAAQCYTFEDFVEHHLARQALAPTFRSGPKRVLVQGHCHQRSLVGTGSLVRLLQRVSGAEVIDLDAGCCGMAGSFGYEKEHYEISRLVGEQQLFPAIRKEPADTVIVAPGFSCRLQIEHFTGRKAVHPATLLRTLLASQNEAPGRPASD